MQPLIWLSFEYFQELEILQLLLEILPVLKDGVILYIFPPLPPYIHLKFLLMKLVGLASCLFTVHL